MEMFRDLTLESTLLRVVLAMVIGGLIGFERGRHNRPAGFRTHMLVCLGASLVMMTNQYAFQYLGGSDPVRMGAQVVSGIGFLGAGTIVMTGKSQIRGITTAAGLWAAACCGLAIGIGFYEGAVLGGMVILVIMTVFQWIETRVRQRGRYMEVYIEVKEETALGTIIEYARQQQLEMHDIQFQKKAIKDGSYCVIAVIHINTRMYHRDVIEYISTVPDVTHVEELQ